MSRPEYKPKQIFVGTGDLNAYTFDFKITHKSHLLVIAVDDQGEEYERVRGDDLVFLSDVTFDPIDGGGTVTLQVDLPPLHNLIVLLANDEPTQDYEFRNKTSFTLRRFEDALDAVAGVIQRLTYRAKQSFRLHDLDNEETFSTQLPPGITEQKSRVFQVNATGDGLEFGPHTDEIANAQQYALDAKGYADQSQIHAGEAEEFKDIAEDAANEAQYLLFNGTGNIATADSPVTLNNGTYNNKIISVNANDGDIVINLDPIGVYTEYFKVQFMRTDDSANTVTIIPNGAETIDLLPDFTLNKGVVVILSIGSPVNWIKKFIGVSSGGSSLPSAGAAGDYLESDGTEAKWTSGIFEGFSARYGQALSLPTVRDALLWIFNFSYLGPQVSLSATGSSGVKEKGVPVTSSTLTASVTKRSTAISRIQFFLNGVSINDNNPPANTGSGNTSYAWTGSFSDTSTFRADVTDVTDGANGPTTASSSVTFTFVYPFFWGASAPDAAVGDLTKQVVANSNNRNVGYSGLAGQKFYYAFPSSYGDLTSIKDENNFEVLGSFTKKSKTWTAADSATVTYTIYELTSPLGVSLSTNFTFIR